MTSCGSNSKVENYPPDSEELSGLIRKEKEVVFNELGIQEKDVEYENMEYRLLKKAKYLGYSFDELLRTDASTEKEEMYGFAYRIFFQNDAKKAVECTKKVMKKLETLYGNPEEDYARDWKRLSEVVESGALSENSLNGGGEWKLSDELRLWLVVRSHSDKDAGLIQTLEIEYRVPHAYEE